MPMKSSHLKLVERTVLRPVAAARKPNAAYRVREHLTEAEMDKLLTAAHIGARVQQAYHPC